MKKQELVVHHHQRNETHIRGNTMFGFSCKRCGRLNNQREVWRYIVKVDKHGYDTYHIRCNHCGQLHELKLEYVANKI